MKEYYECHITMLARDFAVAEMVTKTTGWTFSKIDGDPDLGEGVKCYATKHFNCDRMTKEEVIGALNDAAHLIACSMIEVIRRKVERVIYDDRTKL